MDRSNIGQRGAAAKEKIGFGDQLGNFPTDLHVCVDDFQYSSRKPASIEECLYIEAIVIVIVVVVVEKILVLTHAAEYGIVKHAVRTDDIFFVVAAPESRAR